MERTVRLFFVVLGFLYVNVLVAQEPLKFSEEVTQLTQIKHDNYENVIVITGSSSIRNWRNVKQYFPDKNIINNGFGGSQMSDLLYFCEPLVLDFKPKQVFIYEGDNDIASGKTTEMILKDLGSLIERIREVLPTTQIGLISVKPSPKRWKFRDQYIELNNRYKKVANELEFVKYVDVWSTMLDKSGKPDKTIFMEDGLHMNDKGYKRWAAEFGKHFNDFASQE